MEASLSEMQSEVQEYAREKKLQETQWPVLNFQWGRNAFLDVSINILSSSNKGYKKCTFCWTRVIETKY
jgi:hypothetical protein